jgi:uncharacterized protein (TIGR03435 family)
MLAAANHLWQSTAFAGAVWLVTLALRRKHARVRYAVWLAASVKFLVPFAALAALGRAIPLRTIATVPAPPAEFLLAVDNMTAPFSRTLLPAAPAVSHVVDPTRAAGIVSLTIWLAGSLMILAAWWTKWRRLAAVARTATAAESGRELAATRRLDTTQSALRVAFISADARLEPGVFGVVRPMLLWPREISERLTDGQIDAIVAHEICHVRWRDNAAAALHMLVEAAFWFHPTVWWLGARLIEERERGCDEDVLHLGSEPREYAEGILTICRFQTASPLACVAGVTGADLRRRIEGIMRGHRGEALRGASKAFLAVVLAAAVATPVVAGAWRGGRSAQTTLAQTPGGATPAFDVVSVKPDHSGSLNIFLQAQPGGRIVATNVTLRLLIRNAYRVQDSQIVGGPDWIGTDRFDIEAKAPGNPTQGELQLMLRALMADRFKLTVHNETRELPVYGLTLARADGRLGAQLRRSETDCSAAPGVTRGTPPPAPAAAGTPQARCGFFVGPGTISARGVTMPALAASLSNNVSRVVLDRTSLAGDFDVDLKWTPEGGGGAADSTPDPDTASIFTAVQEQLGLKLESARGPVDVLAIDAAERPPDEP